MNKTSEWEKIGVIGIDAGICWIGDPCYILPDDEDKETKTIGRDWSNFCNLLEETDQDGKRKHTWQFDYSKNHPGLGVCVSTGYGDGTYNVYAKRKDGRVAEVKVVFIDDEVELDDYSTCDNCSREEDNCECEVCSECDCMVDKTCDECLSCEECCECEEEKENNNISTEKR